MVHPTTQIQLLYSVPYSLIDGVDGDYQEVR